MGLTILKAIDTVNKIVKYVIGFFLGIMVILIFFQVLFRFILPFSVPWLEELARYLMLYITFLAAAIALRHQQLISVEVLSEFLSQNNRRILKILVNVVCIVFFILLLQQGIKMLSNVATQQSPALQLPMSIPYAIIPMGALLLIMNGIAVIIELVSKKDVKE